MPKKPAMVRLRYIGPHREVAVPTDRTRAIIVERGAVADFPAELAEGLFAQPANWERPDAPKEES